jgi:hypothetical protein
MTGTISVAAGVGGRTKGKAAMRAKDDPRGLVIGEGFALLCTGDGCTGEVRVGHDGELRVTYGWDSHAAVRSARILRGLSAARARRAGAV